MQRSFYGASEVSGNAAPSFVLTAGNLSRFLMSLKPCISSKCECDMVFVRCMSVANSFVNREENLKLSNHSAALCRDFAVVGKKSGQISWDHLYHPMGKLPMNKGKKIVFAKRQGIEGCRRFLFDRECIHICALGFLARSYDRSGNVCINNRNVEAFGY